MELFGLRGKTAIVTGGNKGIGHGMAKGLAMAGAKVAIMASSDSVFSASEKFRVEGYDVIGIKCNLANENETRAAFDKIVAELGGKLDILVNNAGVQHRSKAEDFPLEKWDYVMDINLRAVFVMSQLAGRNMIGHGGGGKIINVASAMSFFGGVNIPAYSASKGGVAQLTKALANEWASKGINVNAIAPGWTETDLTAAVRNDETANKMASARIPAGRWAKPDEDMLGITIFLASKASDYVNGSVISIDGGFVGR